jgi:hypothetical protein
MGTKNSQMIWSEDMAKLEKLAGPAVQDLLRKDEDQLYKELGMRTRALALEPSRMAGSFDLSVTYDKAAMGPMDDVLELGKRIFTIWTVEANKLLCGTEAGDQEDRKKLQEALGLGETAVAAALAAILVVHLGLAPALAAVVAALIIKRFFNPAYKEFCKTWTNSLPNV